MRAVEFHSMVEDGHIAVPKTFHLPDGLSVRGLILLDEAAEQIGTAFVVRHPSTSNAKTEKPE